VESFNGERQLQQVENKVSSSSGNSWIRSMMSTSSMPFISSDSSCTLFSSRRFLTSCASIDKILYRLKTGTNLHVEHEKALSLLMGCAGVVIQRVDLSLLSARQLVKDHLKREMLFFISLPFYTMEISYSPDGRSGR
jgi:hypothetical protein